MSPGRILFPNLPGISETKNEIAHDPVSGARAIQNPVSTKLLRSAGRVGGVGLFGLLGLLGFLRRGGVHLVLGKDGGGAHEEREAKHEGHNLFHFAIS
jgi:hypothetical protein